jgi:hypothetical protein
MCHQADRQVFPSVGRVPTTEKHGPKQSDPYRQFFILIAASLVCVLIKMTPNLGHTLHSWHSILGPGTPSFEKDVNSVTRNRVQIILRRYNTHWNEQKTPSGYVQKPHAEILVSFWEIRVLRWLDEDSRTGVRRTAAAESIGVPIIWRILHEQPIYLW